MTKSKPAYIVEKKPVDAKGRKLVAQIQIDFKQGQDSMMKAADKTRRFCDQDYPQSYLAAALGVTQAHVSRLYQFGITRQILLETGITPPDHEGTLRPLIAFRRDHEKLVESYEKAAILSDADGKDRITAQHMLQAVAEVKGVNTSVPSWAEADGLLRTLDILIGRIKKSGRSQMHKLLLEVRILLQEEL
jgi:hypothetical protein